ncbi:hypothetical protein ACTQ43_14270 [Segatella copri]|uniref:hypothetical protein n=1 Tax=Segatella copri TaxID=165179 RepID=UPI003F9D2BAE
MTVVIPTTNPGGYTGWGIATERGGVEIWQRQDATNRAHYREIVIHFRRDHDQRVTHEQGTTCELFDCGSHGQHGDRRHRFFDYDGDKRRIESDLREIVADWFSDHKPHIWRDTPDHWVWRCDCGHIGRWRPTHAAALREVSDHLAHMAYLATDEGMRATYASRVESAVAA